jgi:hypothetical protein
MGSISRSKTTKQIEGKEIWEYKIWVCQEKYYQLNWAWHRCETNYQLKKELENSRTTQLKENEFLQPKIKQNSINKKKIYNLYRHNICFTKI